MLGLGRPIGELCLLRLLGLVVTVVPTVDTLALLGERTTGWCVTRKLPDCRESDWRGTFTLVAEDAGGAATHRLQRDCRQEQDGKSKSFLTGQPRS